MVIFSLVIVSELQSWTLIMLDFLQLGTCFLKDGTALYSLVSVISIV